MSYCPDCRVEIDDDRDLCPLCSSAPVDTIDSETPESRTHFPARTFAPSGLSRREKRRIAFQVYSILLFAAITISVGINLLIEHTIGWSYLVIVSLLFAWIIPGSYYYLKKRPLIATLINFIAMPLLILAIDVYDQSRVWFLKLALPLYLLFALLIISIVLVILQTKRKGLNIIGMIMMLMTLFLLCLDAFINYYFYVQFFLTWSIGVAIIAIPVAMVLLFVHYKVTNKYDFKRIFHV